LSNGITDSRLAVRTVTATLTDAQNQNTQMQGAWASKQAAALNSYQTASMPDTQNNAGILGVRKDQKPGKYVVFKAN